MAPVLHGNQALRHMFAGLVEQTFQTELGVVEPGVLDYLSGLLARFIRMDVIYQVRDPSGRRLQEVAEMLAEADQRQGKPQREVHRHIGDLTLFWTGIYPEALTILCDTQRKDHLINYRQHGKRSYYIASTFEEAPYEEEAPVLRKLSEDFELCTVGLNRVRKAWEQFAKEQGAAEQN